jgi:hypothetical protein
VFDAERVQLPCTLVHGTASPATETSVHMLVIEQQQYVD